MQEKWVVAASGANGACRFLVIFVAICCYLLLFVAICCYLLRFPGPLD